MWLQDIFPYFCKNSQNIPSGNPVCERYQGLVYKIIKYLPKSPNSSFFNIHINIHTYVYERVAMKPITDHVIKFFEDKFADGQM
jgi:hypothetical protein